MREMNEVDGANSSPRPMG